VEETLFFSGFDGAPDVTKKTENKWHHLLMSLRFLGDFKNPSHLGEFFSNLSHIQL